MPMRGTAGQTAQEVNNGQFLQGGQGWSGVGDNWVWSKDPIGALHETGAIDPLFQDLTSVIVNTDTYAISCQVSGRTAGAVTIKLGSSGTEVIINNNEPVYFENIFEGNYQLKLIPNTDFDGIVRYISVKKLKKQP